MDEHGGADPEQEAAELIEVYFELEEPAERDALFDQIATIRAPVVTEFLRAMMAQDEDEYVRAAAAGELARRGDGPAIAALEADLDDADESFFFEHAVQVLGEVRGKHFYDTLAHIWRDPERDADQRREAMLGMEVADAPRALADFVAFLDGITDVESMPDDQVELAMLAFVRAGHTAAAPVLERLRDRVAQSRLAEDERRELAGMIEEGLALLRG